MWFVLVSSLTLLPIPKPASNSCLQLAMAAPRPSYHAALGITAAIVGTLRDRAGPAVGAQGFGDLLGQGEMTITRLVANLAAPNTPDGMTREQLVCVLLGIALPEQVCA